MKLIRKRCACGCGQSWMASMGSFNKYFSEIHEHANPKVLNIKKKKYKDPRQRELRIRRQNKDMDWL
jgi:hypothetical protein